LRRRFQILVSFRRIEPRHAVRHLIGVGRSSEPIRIVHRLFDFKENNFTRTLIIIADAMLDLL